jgi:hypothetical protein
MSTINTNGINVNYPVPGVNNSSQGFRDNFAAIKTNLDTAGSEISDLQSKVVLKQALANTTINNDMGNTLISNAATRNFRATTYNLGNALANTVSVDTTLADVFYGTISANTTLSFTNWAPAGTERVIQLQLAVSNANAFLTFPSALATSADSGATTLENYSNVGGLVTLSVPYGVSELNYNLTTIDCGTTLTIEPTNRPRVANEIQVRNPIPTGFPGDNPGEIALGASIDQLTITATTTSTNLITTSGNTTQLFTDLPISFTGNASGTGLTAGSTYYVRNVYSSTQFTVSSSLGGANVSLSTATPTLYANPQDYLYVCTDTYNSTTYSKTVSATTVTTNAITLNNTTSLTLNSPIIFSANIGGLVANTNYYIKSISSPNITVSQSRTNGVADTVVTLSTASGTVTATAYVGLDIWKRINLNSW